MEAPTRCKLDRLDVLFWGEKRNKRNKNEKTLCQVFLVLDISLCGYSRQMDRNIEIPEGSPFDSDTASDEPVSRSWRDTPVPAQIGRIRLRMSISCLSHVEG